MNRRPCLVQEQVSCHHLAAALFIATVVLIEE